MATVPFMIQISDHKLEHLKQKLALADFPDRGPADSEDLWRRGVPVAEIHRLATVWRISYDWRKVEAQLNTFPQYRTTVNVKGFGLYEIHHIHMRSSRTDAIPLLFLHSWPGSFLEVTKMLKDLVEGPSDNVAFHIIAPSLIDFGFSSGNNAEYFGIDQHAEAMNELMLALGYEKYVVQAGDIGYIIARFISLKYGGKGCLALHTTTPAPIEPDPKTHPELCAEIRSNQPSEKEIHALERAGNFSKEGLGYYQLLSTKPQTIKYSLRDSPVGLLAWVYEKMHDWADNYNWTDDEILTWVSIYYFSEPGPEASSNIYWAMEHREPAAFAAASAYSNVPLGVTRFANDLVLLPKLWNRTLGPVVFEGEYESGGHFAAWERPEAIIQDLQSMFGTEGGAYHIAQFLADPERSGPSTSVQS